MNIPGLRSPSDTTGGLVHFGRMLDKIKLHAAGKLPPDYHANLGKGFDGRVCRLLGVEYDDVIARLKLGGTDDEILQWCYQQGRQPPPGELDVFNSYLAKRGWRDDASDRLAERKKQAGWADRDDIQTFFDLIEADEVRAPRTRLV
ncbi:MAG: DUF5069 domain-containing protein [Acidobacteria bacterium]|nr:DUF5069 domain-containing protein [Acidobacteriota bacterium]